VEDLQKGRCAVRRSQQTARLYLNGRYAGTVKVNGWDNSWGFGEFSPAEGFARYAPRFGAWSLLMHADDGDDDSADGRLSPEAAEELREVENEIDRIHARLFLVGPGEWRNITQLNIDGPLIEWKEDYAREVVHSGA
jgi:hypothetical protein